MYAEFKVRVNGLTADRAEEVRAVLAERILALLGELSDEVPEMKMATSVVDEVRLPRRLSQTTVGGDRPELDGSDG